MERRERVREALLARRVEVLAGLRDQAEQLRLVRRDRAADFADDEHDPEGSTLSAAWQLLDGVHRAHLEELGQLEAALERIEEASFGRCEACGREIPVERLLVRPQATRCVECAAGRRV